MYGSKEYLFTCISVLGTGTRVLGLTPLRICGTSGEALPTCKTWWSRRSSGCWQARRRKLVSMCSRCLTPVTSTTCKLPLSRHFMDESTCTYILTHTCVCIRPKEELGCFDFVYFKGVLIQKNLFWNSVKILGNKPGVGSWRFQPHHWHTCAHPGILPPFSSVVTSASIFYIPFWSKFAQSASFKCVVTNTGKHIRTYVHPPNTETVI